jgi:hypothetical protein
MHCDKNKWAGFVLFLFVILISGCQTGRRDLHPLTHDLLLSGMGGETKALAGFDAYAGSPKMKAFAASMGEKGDFMAWGQA